MKMRIIRTQDGVWIGWPGRARFFRAEHNTSAAVTATHEEVRAPMTGKIVKVNVAVGANVKSGDIVVIMEAMKMEYRLAAPHDGVVDGIFCAPGDLVDLGKKLVTIEPP